MRQADKIFHLKEDGFVGSIYMGNKHTDCALIYLPGAGMDEQMTIDCAMDYAKEGYTVLVLGFYGWREIPKEMYGIPADYMEKAVEWLKSQGIKKIALHGASTGAGYALLCASLIPAISCVIANVPFEYVMEGMKNRRTRTHSSQYTWHGKDIPYSPYAELDKKSMLKVLVEFLKDKNYDMPHMMRYTYDKSDLSEDSRIKIENMEADILMLGAENDDCWPSETAVRRMEKLLREKEYPHKVKAIVYPKASHILIAMPPSMRKDMKKLGKMITAEKKYPEECEKARIEAMRESMEFLEEWYGKNEAVWNKVKSDLMQSEEGIGIEGGLSSEQLREKLGV